MRAKAPVMLAAGGTGGHLFPAEALAAVLAVRGCDVVLATDERVLQHSTQFAPDHVFMIPSATFKSRHPLALLASGFRLVSGFVKALQVIRQVRPAAVVGFGGYPTVPPVLAAWLLGVPTVLHEQNGVLGRANRFLAPKVRAIGTGLERVKGLEGALAAKVRFVGNPLRPAVMRAIRPFPALTGQDMFELLVTGGSQGARVMSDCVPEAVALLPEAIRKRLHIVQQARPEDVERVRASYAASGVDAEVAAFFTDLPERIAAAHLVIGRAGASTVAELAAIGRPSILVPLPHSLDNDQAANAAFLAEAGAADVINQSAFTPQWLSQRLQHHMTDIKSLTDSAQSAKKRGITDGAERFADLVLESVGTESGLSQ
jgi:UDP-N-acetylglucosamine--N-acetylmuramyl-(pentapeptide) pyrophosphoryl-undecaprenol N-acetylglucosamine transferase